MSDKPKFKVGDLVTWKKKYSWMVDKGYGPYLVIKVYHRGSFSSGVAYTKVSAIAPGGLIIELNEDQVKKV
jgi:hypothetical protein